ncbi:MAG: HAD family hydrolase [Candidatus Izemoplasmataceae bacterium]
MIGKNIKAILFDMDGVITDTDDLHYHVWQEILKEEGIELTEEMYINHLQSTSHKKALLSIFDDISEDDITRISNEKNKRSKALLQKEIKINQDAINLIKYLHQNGYVLAVVSASSNAEFVIKEIKIEAYFDMIISGPGETSIRNKPFPDIYEYAMEKLGVTPSETVVIEDSVSGITAGLRSGAYVFGINRGNLHIEENKELKVVNDLHEVIEFFNQ